MSKRPNILFIVTDQQRADTIGALGNGIIRTPVLDELCAQGTAFTRAYTPAPICSPARVAMVTGRPPHQHRFTDHDWWYREPDAETPEAQRPPRDVAFMKHCLDAGYETFWAGKMHHSGRSWLTDGVEACADGEKPSQLSPHCRQVATYEEFFTERGYPPYNRPSMNLGSEYYMVPQVTNAPLEETHPWWMAEQCRGFLERRDRERPFLLQCHFPEPHPPITNPMPWAMLYRACEMEAPWRPADYPQYQARTNRYQNRYKCRDTSEEDDTGYRILKAAYYANISLLDRSIGHILEALGDERDNTLIIFTTDHGEMLGDYGCVGKRCMMEASIRLPMIAALPGRIPAGHRCETPVSLMDFFPTVMEAAGLTVDPPGGEGRSLIGTANRSLAGEPDDRIVCSQFSSGWCGQYAATDGKWKYAYSAPDDREWLFQLEDAVLERENRVRDPEVAAIRERLKGALMKRHDPSVDPWSDAVEKGDWKRHRVPPEPWRNDPVYGYLNQDKGREELQAAVDELGPYARQVINLQRGGLHGDHGVCGGVSPFARKG